jgi:NADH:ubiquinone oxidoreductase subunit 5 (subunit L)/multisubunit Na+/H+ antiporter MnhA subunit
VWGIALAAYRYGGKRRAERIVESDRQPSLLIALCRSGWYLDYLYDLLIVRPYKHIAETLWKRVDEGAIDRSINSFAAMLGSTGQWLGNWGRGKLSAYILSMAAGAALVIVYMAWAAQ